MTETTADPTVANCSNCEALVARRRPSVTGRHYCSKPDCQRAKARFFYHRRNDEGRITQAREVEVAAELEQRRATLRDDEIAEFIRSAEHEPRIDCADCGRTNVVPGYAHPNLEWDSACRALQSKPLPTDGFAGRIMSAVYPQ